MATLKIEPEASDPASNQTLNTAVALAPLVLVENEATYDGQYDWQDSTGERYQYPNQYRRKLIPGRRFVYYRGVRRAEGRGPAEYFGCGTIGEQWRDESVPESERKAKWKWFSQIEDYSPFTTPVPASVKGQYWETITHARGWQVGVRTISEDAFDKLVKAGLDFNPFGSTYSTPVAASPVLTEASDLLRVRSATKAGVSVSAGPARRSKESARVGRRAEEIVVTHLKAKHGNARWLSDEKILPGYDIEFVDGSHQAVEVKGTIASSFACIELTANEWAAAERLRERYWLYLVARCMSSAPRLQVIQDPFALVQSATARVTPTVYRLELLVGTASLQAALVSA